ncbi:MAG TPA: antibiotic biosynthesis monooxygenase [Acidimicrobiia bacterium]|nr:antibiotic biosynthesis monooxygenase [Acidimicrobiia bacterium]
MTEPNDAPFLTMWRYRIRPEHIAEFERAYGPDGEWAELFRRGDGYLGTELVRGATPGEYATIDRWVSAEAHADFLDRWRDDYAALDRRTEVLTDEEHHVLHGDLVE